jgi:GntR family transcriptional regulator
VVDPLSPVALYVQIADALAELIRRGTLPEGRPIPSETAIQQEFGVARGTARAAVALLRTRGLVYTIPQRGTYVGQPPA